MTSRRLLHCLRVCLSTLFLVGYLFVIFMVSFIGIFTHKSFTSSVMHLDCGSIVNLTRSCANVVELFTLYVYDSFIRSRSILLHHVSAS